MRKQPTHAPAADSEQRPLPRKDFSAPQELVPGLLMAWDFCSTYRQSCHKKPLLLCQCRGLFRFPPSLLLQCMAYYS